VVPCPRLSYNEPGTTYTVLKYPEDIQASVVTIPTTLRFMARDCDPTTGIPDAEQGYHDEYMVKDSVKIILYRNINISIGKQHKINFPHGEEKIILNDYSFYIMLKRNYYLLFTKLIYD